MKNKIITTHQITNTEQMLHLGAVLAKKCSGGSIIYLEGELGAGKTTLVRGFVRALGYLGLVKSPTYTLIESYELDSLHVYHMDLYRLTNPTELQAIGLSDYLTSHSICLIEWPEKAEKLLPKPNWRCTIEILPHGQGRSVNIEEVSCEDQKD